MTPATTLCPRRSAQFALVLAAALAVPAVAWSQTAPAPPQQPAMGVVDRVLVRVSGRAILHSEFEQLMEDQLNVIRAQIPQDEIDAQLPALRLRTMEAQCVQVVMQLRAEELGIVANPNDIDRALQNLRNDNGLLDDDQWVQALASTGLTEPELREQLADRIVLQQMSMQEIQRQVFVSQRDIATYYEENPGDFIEPEEVLYQQLIFVYQGDDRAPIRERADNALSELRGGASLTTVGGKYAVPDVDVVQDASEANWISPEDIQAEIRTVMDALTPLEYSDVIEGRFGYVIIQLMDRKAGRTVPLEEVADLVRAQLMDQRMVEKSEEYGRELMQAASLEIYAEEFSDLVNAWNEDGQGATGTPGQRR